MYTNLYTEVNERRQTVDRLANEIRMATASRFGLEQAYDHLHQLETLRDPGKAGRGDALVLIWKAIARTSDVIEWLLKAQGEEKQALAQAERECSLGKRPTPGLGPDLVGGK